MKKYKVRLSETFLWDMIDITLYLLDKSGNVQVPRRFYNDVLSSIEKRSFGADSYEAFFPYKGSPGYRRLYFGKYTIFYVIENDEMDVRRILWSGVDDFRKL